MKCDRRTFIKGMTMTGGALAAGGFNLISCSKADQQASFFTEFANPPSGARPFYRWWWNGNRVTATEIKRELRLMQEQGAGGVEINPIALDPELYPDPVGGPLDWLSDEWLRMVQVTVNEAKKLDMTVDLMVGTGWPFGGKFLSSDETIQGVELEVIPVKGGSPFKTQVHIPGDANHKLMQLLLCPVPVHSLDDAIDVTDRWQADGLLELDVPNGEFELYILTWRNRFRDVLFGAPGGDGPVLDHFNQHAVKKYLHRMSDALKTVLGNDLGQHIRSMFCDSIELEGANWTGDMAEQFQERRGYDLLPWLPFVLDRDAKTSGALHDKIRRARYDMALTLSELFMERFIQPFHDWCHENNVQSRYQAYGHPWLYTDLLDGYMVPDIPESDQWLYNRGWVPEAEIDQIRYAIWNKYTASGAHLAGRKVISCEAMTNSKGVFLSTLEYIKQATDLDTVCGINHLVLHGYNYSPPAAGFPGWIRFGTFFNDQNTWWPYARHWFDYAARLAFVFQNSQAVAQIAILGNTPDKWADYGLDRNPWNMQPHYLHQLWQALNHHGYLADYVNNTVLNGAQFKDGDILYGPMRYQMLLVTDAQSLNVATLHALERYAAAGGRIVFIGTLPKRVPGMEKEKRDIAGRMAKLVQNYPQQVQKINAPLPKTVPTWTRDVLVPRLVPADVRFSIVDERLFFIRHVRDDMDIYFISNQHRDVSLHFDAEFPTGDKIAYRLDAETGESTRYPVNGNPEKLCIQLGPLESLLLVFSDQDVTLPSDDPVTTEEHLTELNGPWQVEMQHMDGRQYQLKLDNLQDLTLLPHGRDFAGTAIYSTTFVSPLTGNAVLDLGSVHEIADVQLDGQSLDVTWWGKRNVELTGLETGREYTLRIAVTGLLFNYCLSLKDNPVAQHWVKRTDVDNPVPFGLLGPVGIAGKG